MNSELLETVKSNIDVLTDSLSGKFVAVFGINHPGDFIIRYLRQRGISVNAVIDNNPANTGIVFEGVSVTTPENALSIFNGRAAVLICSKYYPEMLRQLEGMGYKKDVHIFRLLNIGGSGEFSLDKEIFLEKVEEAAKGAVLADRIIFGFNAESLLVCPVKANGDVFIACSFLKKYLSRNGIKRSVLVVIGNACAGIAEMFGVNNIYTASQNEVDQLTAAYRILNDKKRINILQPFWDYTSFLNRLDCYKGLNFYDYYRHWVFELETGVPAERPNAVNNLERISVLFEKSDLLKNKTVILSPYANSLSGIPTELFEALAVSLKNEGYSVATNVSGSETPVAGTVPLALPICDLISSAEYAGAFIGIRNGLCDILSLASCKKAVIYPQKAYAFGTTLELYGISGFSSGSVLELVFDGGVEKCVRQITDYFTECETFEQN